MHILEADFPDRLICFRKCVFQRRTGGCDAKDAAAVGQVFTVFPAGAGMIYDDACPLAVFIQTMDLIALLIALRITAGCLDDACAGFFGPFDFDILPECRHGMPS